MSEEQKSETQEKLARLRQTVEGLKESVTLRSVEDAVREGDKQNNQLVELL